MSGPESTPTPEASDGGSQLLHVGPLRADRDEVALYLTVLAPGMSEAHRDALHTLLLQVAGDGGRFAGSASSSRHHSLSAVTRHRYVLGELIDALQRAQSDGDLPALSYQAYSDDLRSELQEIVMHTPDLGTFQGRCDSRGNVVLTDRQVATALGNASETGAAEALSRLAGLPWSAHLELLSSPALTTGSTPSTSEVTA